MTERRHVNIADVHGEMSIETLNEISMLFQGFLVQIALSDFIANQAQVIKYLTSLPPQVYVQLILRDVRSENDTKLKAAIDKIRSHCSTCHVSSIPNVADKTSIQNKTKMKILRDSILPKTTLLSSLNEATTRAYLERLIDPSDREQIQDDQNFIQETERLLIIGRPDDYPLYSAFMKACKARLEIAKTDPYGRDFKSERLFQLNDELFNADAEFKRIQELGSNHFGAAFQVFLKLL